MNFSLSLPSYTVKWTASKKYFVWKGSFSHSSSADNRTQHILRETEYHNYCYMLRQRLRTLWGMTSVHLTCLMQWIKNRNSLKTWSFWYDQFSLCLTVKAESLWLISSPSSVPPCSSKREVKVRSYWVSNQSVTYHYFTLFMLLLQPDGTFLTNKYYFTSRCILNAIYCRCMLFIQYLIKHILFVLLQIK